MEKSAFTREHQVFVDLLRRLRVEAALTQVQLGELIDENQVFVSRYERGETRLDIVQIRHICSVLGVTLVDLMTAYERRLAEAG